MDGIPIKVDFTDAADIAAKLPIARALHAQRAAEAEALDMLVQLMERIAPDERRSDANRASHGPDEAQQQSSPRDIQPVDLVVSIVNHENRRIRSLEVAKRLRAEGYDVSNMTVSNSLHYAAHRAKPPRIRAAEGRGYYEPLAEAAPEVPRSYSGSHEHSQGALPDPSSARGAV